MEASLWLMRLVSEKNVLNSIQNVIIHSIHIIYMPYVMNSARTGAEAAQNYPERIHGTDLMTALWASGWK